MTIGAGEGAGFHAGDGNESIGAGENAGLHLALGRCGPCPAFHFEEGAGVHVQAGEAQAGAGEHLADHIKAVCGPCAPLHQDMGAGVHAGNASMGAHEHAAVMLCHPPPPCPPPTGVREAAAIKAKAGDVGAEMHEGMMIHAVGCIPPPCTPAPQPGLHEGAGAHANADGIDVHAGEHAMVRPMPPPCGPCGPQPGVHIGAAEGAGAHVQAGNVSAGVHEDAGLHVGDRMLHPCHPPCPGPGGPGGAGVHEGAGVKVKDGNETIVAIGERADVKLRLGEGCRDHPGDPNGDDMKLGRRVHAIEQALDAMGHRLDRLNATLNRLIDHLSDGNLTTEQMDKLNERIGHLLDEMDKVSQKLQDLTDDLDQILQHLGG